MTVGVQVARESQSRVASLRHRQFGLQELIRTEPHLIEDEEAHIEGILQQLDPRLQRLILCLDNTNSLSQDDALPLPETGSTLTLGLRLEHDLYSKRTWKKREERGLE